MFDNYQFMNDTDLPVKLLWTGGWDSTFRLLELVLNQKKMVQPYYLVSPAKRQTTDIELLTMDKIRSMIYKKQPGSESLLLPTIYKEVSKVKPNVAITEEYNRLTAAKVLGSQYEYLARYAEEEGITGLELSVEKYRNKPTYAFEKTNMFKYFTFPLVNTTKLEMQEAAIKYGFLDLLDETFFCHTPINGKPCGCCNPCRIALEEGLGRRLPFERRLKFHLKRLPLVKQIINLIKPGNKKEATTYT